jgi:hypothetical protein
MALLFLGKNLTGSVRRLLTLTINTNSCVLAKDKIATCFDNYVVIFRSLRYIHLNYSCKFFCYGHMEISALRWYSVLSVHKVKRLGHTHRN